MREQGLARSADVFCEPGWFSLEQSEDILRASRKEGLALRMHVDEFSDGSGGALACELGVETADHAYHTPFEVREAMKDRNVNTGFLPGTPYAMGDQWPDMHQVVESEIPFTLATDFNPNCRTLSLPFMCSLMVQRCGMHPLDALAAVSVRAGKTTPHPSGRPHGVLEEGLLQISTSSMALIGNRLLCDHQRRRSLELSWAVDSLLIDIRRFIF